MLYEDLFSSFVDSYNGGDMKSANLALMRELANILVSNKDEFVHLLNDSEIPATMDMTNVRLVDLFIQNVDKNPKLVFGASLLINHHNKQLGFDGDEEISDEHLKAAYSCMMSCFNGDSEDYSNGIGEAIAGAIQGVAGATTSISQGQQKKKYGATDLAQQKQDAKSAMVQQILAQRQAQLDTAQKEKDRKAKTTKTILIVSGAVVGLAILGFVIYKIKSKKK